MKKTLLTVSFILAVAAGCSNTNSPDMTNIHPANQETNSTAVSQRPNEPDTHSPDFSALALATYYKSLDEMMYDSEVVAEVELTGEKEEITYAGANFTLSKAKIKKLFKGDPALKDSTIKIIQIGFFSMENEKTKNDQRLLFLQLNQGEMEGGDDAYAIVGVYQGNFKIDDAGKLVYDYDQFGGVNTFQSSISGLSIGEAEKRIQTSEKNKIQPQRGPIRTQAEQKTMEEESKRLFEADRKSLEESEAEWNK